MDEVGVGVATEAPGCVWHGERIDALKNCFRWYRVWVQPDLFGVWAVWTAWGRIGSKTYRLRLQPAATRDEAEQKARALIRRKTQRGYQSTARRPSLR